MNFEIDEITIKNLFRFPGTTLKVPRGDTLIVGMNEDSDGADSNGSGKSALLDSICWAITGDTIRPLDVRGIITEGEEEGGVELTLEDTETRNKYKIIRYRGGKETLAFELKTPAGKVEKLTRRTNTQTQEEIFRLLNLDFKRYMSDYTNTTYFSSSTVNGIASRQTSNADRMALLTRFLNVSIFDLATERAKSLYKAEAHALELSQDKEAQLLGFVPSEFKDLDAYEKYLNSEVVEMNTSKTQWIEYRSGLLQQKEIVSDIEKKRLLIENIRLRKKQYEETKARIAKLTLQKEALEKELEGLNKDAGSGEDLVMAEDGIQEAEAEISLLTSEMASFKKDISLFEAQLRVPLTCPSCNASLYLKGTTLSKIDIEALNEELKKAKVALDVRLKDIDKSQKDKRDLQNIVIGIHENNRVFSDKKARLSTISESLDDITYAEEDFDSQIAEIEATIDTSVDVKELEANLREADSSLEQLNTGIGQIKEILRNVIKTRGELKEVSVAKTSQEINLKNYDTWVRAFPAIKQMLIEAYLPLFETGTNYYLGVLNSGLSVSLTLEKELKSGKIKPEFQILVTDEHGKTRSYDSYSEGERKRIATCIGYSIRRIAISRNSLPLGFIKFDEIIDGLDSTGVSEFFKLLKTLSGQKLIVSHSDELKNMFSSLIVAHRKNGKTSLRASNA